MMEKSNIDILLDDFKERTLKTMYDLVRDRFQEFFDLAFSGMKYFVEKDMMMLKEEKNKLKAEQEVREPIRSICFCNILQLFSFPFVQQFYLHTPSFFIGLVITESGLIVRSFS